MNNTYLLGMNRRKALAYLKFVSGDLEICGNRDIRVDTLADVSVGDAVVDNHSHAFSSVRIGIENLSGNKTFPFAKVSDLQFTRMVVSLYHEYGHYLQNYGVDRNVDLFISEASVIGNKKYYVDNKHRLPHEIAAELTGIKEAWERLRIDFSDQADKCMLEYVNYRARCSTYMIPDVKNGYKSYDEVIKAFDDAMIKSLDEPRVTTGNFVSIPGESADLLKVGISDFRKSPNYHHIEKLEGRMTGRQKDRMIAALVIHKHPDVLDIWPELKDEGLTVENMFGKPLVDELPPGYVPKWEHLKTPEYVTRGQKRDEYDGPNI